MQEKLKDSHPILHKYLFTVTTLSKLLAMFLFIILPFIGFYLGMQYQRIISVQQTTALPIVKQQVQKPYAFVKTDNAYLFINFADGYTLNFSPIPDAVMSEQPPGFAYDFDMYKLKISSGRAGDMGGSVARFSISMLLTNNEKLTLQEYATKNLGYVKGKTSVPSQYSQEMSGIEQITLGKNTAITWSNTRTDAAGGPYFHKYYLISLNNKLVYLDMYSWTSSDFQTALPAFEKVASSLSPLQ
jgi:hypothetical protein